MKPKALLSLLAVTGVFLNAEMTPAQTVLPSVRTPPADSTSGTPGSGTNHNFTVAGEIDRGRTPSDYSFQDFPILAGGTANVNNPVGSRKMIPRVTESLLSALNGVLNTQGANFLLINLNGVVLGSNVQLNVDKAVAASSTNGVKLFDGKSQQYIFGANPGSAASLLTNATGRINLESANPKNTLRPNAEGKISDNRVNANPSGVINESGTVGNSNKSNTNVTPTGDISISGTIPQLNQPMGNDNQSSRSSDPNRVDNAGKMKIGTENRGNLQPDRSTVSNSVREVDLGNVSLIVSTDPTDKDDLGDIKIYTTGTLGVTNSSGISSTSFSQGKTGDISVTSDRVTLENGSIKAQSIGMIDGNIKLTALDRLLLKNLSGISLNSGNKAPTDPNNRGSQACGAIGSVTTNSSKLALPATGWVLDGAGKVTIVAMGTEIEPKQTGVVCPNMVGK